MTKSPKDTSSPKAWHPDAPARCEESFDDLANAFPGYGRPIHDGIPAGDGPADELDEPSFPLTAAASGRTTPGIAPRLPLDDAGAGPSFSMDRFASELRARLDGNCTGWAFVLNRNGQEAVADAGGGAILPSDVDGGGTAIGTRDFTPDTRIEVASVSKIVTTFAVMRLLEEVGIGINSPIAPWLPSGWTPGPNVSQLTFRHLLTHSTGLTSTNSNFTLTLSNAGLAMAIAGGATPGATYNYLNANFALFRVIIPALWAASSPVPATADTDLRSAFFYTIYVIEEILGRMGGTIGPEASTSPLEGRPARYYPSAGAPQGMDFPNYTMVCGAIGWQLSARELAAILAFTTYTDNIISEGARTVMDGFRLGWRPQGYYPGAFGDYVGHDGSINVPATGFRGRTRTAIMKFGLQVEAAVVVNSLIGTPGASLAPDFALQQAYDAAWA